MMVEPILKLLSRKGYKPLTAAEMLEQFRLRPDRLGELQEALGELEQSGRVSKVSGRRYVKAKGKPAPRETQTGAPERRQTQPQQRHAHEPRTQERSRPEKRPSAPEKYNSPARSPGRKLKRSEHEDLVSGRIRVTRGGKGFVSVTEDGISREIEISAGHKLTALNNDRVLVRRNDSRAGDQATGSVVEVLQRKRSRLVGTFQRRGRAIFVIPDDPRIPHEILTPEPRDVGRRANEGDKVVVELKEWASEHDQPEGEIVEVLGAPDEEGVDMLSVLRQYDLPLSFPPEVLAEARAIGSQVREEDVAGRVDCREHPVVTIDPDDAKDFDDAICLRRAGQGTWRLWVHIADVSHYVRTGSALDEEAKKRGNSTYLVDRVIPMLPEALSNELCSLKPNVDRLTKCVEFRISDNGEVLQSRFYAAVIHSKRRYTYQEVLKLLRGKAQAPLEEMLHQANSLAQKIRRRRFHAGSLDLDFPERKIRLDERGRVIRIEKVENDISHQLIEEFMLLANEAVAGEFMRLNLPAIYRVHEEPGEQRLREFQEEVRSHEIQVGDLRKRREVQDLLKRLGEMAIGPALKIGFLRSLMRARYAAEPLGHYGLAKEKYTHFTSPIRRYADLIVHRVLFKGTKYRARELEEISEHISETERNSADAERDSKDLKLFAYLRAQLESGELETYDALIIELRNFGFFVDVPDLTLNGLVPLASIEDDYYVYDPRRNLLTGRRSRQILRVGDRVKVRVYKVDSYKKQVDFTMSEGPAETNRSGSGRPQGNFGKRRALERSFREKSARDEFRPSRHKRGENQRGEDPRSGRGPTGGHRAGERQPAASKGGGQPHKSGSGKPSWKKSSRPRRQRNNRPAFKLNR